MANKRQATVLLEHRLKQLKLPTMLGEYASVAAVCGRENVSFDTFLLRPSERELLTGEFSDRRVREGVGISISFRLGW